MLKRSVGHTHQRLLLLLETASVPGVSLRAWGWSPISHEHDDNRIQFRPRASLCVASKSGQPLLAISHACGSSLLKRCLLAACCLEKDAPRLRTCAVIGKRVMPVEGLPSWLTLPKRVIPAAEQWQGVLAPALATFFVTASAGLAAYRICMEWHPLNRK